MADMFGYIFEFCYSFFKHMDEKFKYDILQTKLSIWVKISYKQDGAETKEFTFTYSPCDYLEFGRLNKRQIYRDFVGDIGNVIQIIEGMKLD